jgi:hypothetical protein
LSTFGDLVPDAVWCRLAGSLQPLHDLEFWLLRKESGDFFHLVKQVLAFTECIEKASGIQVARP